MTSAGKKASTTQNMARAFLPTSSVPSNGEIGCVRGRVSLTMGWNQAGEGLGTWPVWKPHCKPASRLPSSVPRHVAAIPETASWLASGKTGWAGIPALMFLPIRGPTKSREAAGAGSLGASKQIYRTERTYSGFSGPLWPAWPHLPSLCCDFLIARHTCRLLAISLTQWAPSLLRALALFPLSWLLLIQIFLWLEIAYLLQVFSTQIHILNAAYTNFCFWGDMYTTERLHFHFSLSCIGEGNGNPLQYSCLENPRDGGACWAAVYGVAQSRTRLKRLSSSSSSSSSMITFCLIF